MNTFSLPHIFDKDWSITGLPFSMVWEQKATLYTQSRENGPGNRSISAGKWL